MELRRRRYSESPTTATTIDPSGETSGVARLNVPTGGNSYPGGGFNDNFQVCATPAPVARSPRENAMKPTTARMAAAAAIAIGHFHARRGAAGVSIAVCSTSAISSMRSCAHCHRSSGSFARHRLTMRSSASGISAGFPTRLDTDGGSDRRIAAVTLARFSASNARSPVSIW